MEPDGARELALESGDTQWACQPSWHAVKNFGTRPVVTRPSEFLWCSSLCPSRELLPFRRALCRSRPLHALAMTSSATALVPSTSELVPSTPGFPPPGLLLSWLFSVRVSCGARQVLSTLVFLRRVFLLWKTLCNFNHEENLLSFQWDC